MLSRIGRARWIAGMLAVGLIPLAHAEEFDVGSGVQLRWDTTLRATLALRTESADPALLANPNADDGDRAFPPGIISKRLDIVSELDLSKNDLGLDVSGDGWYDAAYHGRTANRSPATFNPTSVANTEFPKDVQALQGDTAELLTAYVHDKIAIGDMPLTVRLGRQTLIWGESLFFADNGIAAGQGPVDDIKALSQPLAQARELFLPVTQAVASLQLRPDTLLEGYFQTEWRPDRLPGVDSYFSSTDILDIGGERLLDGASFLDRGRDRTPPGPGQFGVALHVSTDIADLGLYALRFDAKSPQIFVTSSGTTAGGSIGQYGLIYPRDIEIYGVSAGSYIGDSNVAGEISVRRNMPLVSRLPALTGADGPTPYAVGETLHAQVSLTSTLPPGRLWQGAELDAELAANDRLAITRDPAAFAPGLDAFAAALRVVFTPQYFEVLPHLDVTIPLGFSIDAIGRSSVDDAEQQGAGDVDVGIAVTYRTVWQAGINFTHFFGSVEHQPLGDRDFVAITFTRTF